MINFFHRQIPNPILFSFGPINIYWYGFCIIIGNIFKIWQGGLAIHGGIIAGIITLWIFSKKQKLNFWKITALAVSVMPLAQAMGRWGNYFNNELFGLPTSAPWGIPVLPENKIMEFYDYSFFHPTFLYESIGNLIIFIILVVLIFWIVKYYKILKQRHINAKNI